MIGGRRQTSDTPAKTELRTLRDYTGRGVVTTSTYEARALGVFSGMGLMKSAKLAPDALLLPADFDEYRHYSRLFKAAVRAVAPEIEDRGIDEIYIDLTALVMAEAPGAALDPWQRAREVAARIQQAVFEATGLSCSIGVTPNKLLSKIASDLDKPAGLTILREADVVTRLWPLPVRKINGIGPKAGTKLEALGIRTIGELAQLYQIATVAFVGGSLVNAGGHNILEPAMFGRPIVFGPHMQNFAEIAQTFLQNGAAVQVKGAAELERVLVDLMADPVIRARLGAAARALVDANRGARERTLAAVAEVLPPEDRAKGSVIPFRVGH